VEHFIKVGLPFIFFVLTGTLKSIGNVLALEGQSRKLVDVFGVDWISPIQPENYVVHPAYQELGEMHNFASGIEHW
jgi:hypothetical protein